MGSVTEELKDMETIITVQKARLHDLMQQEQQAIKDDAPNPTLAKFRIEISKEMRSLFTYLNKYAAFKQFQPTNPEEKTISMKTEASPALLASTPTVGLSFDSANRILRAVELMTHPTVSSRRSEDKILDGDLGGVLGDLDSNGS